MQDFNVAVREQAEAAEETVAIAHSEPRGTIRVACPVTLAQSTIAPLIPAFLARHPQVRIDMQVSNRVVDLWCRRASTWRCGCDPAWTTAAA